MVGKRIVLPLLVLLLLALLSCPNQGSSSTVYDRIVIDTFYPTTPGNWLDTQLTLIDSGGNTLAFNDDGNPDQGTHIEYSRIDQAGLSAGTYYIKVNSLTGGTIGFYAIRVLDSILNTFPDLGSTTNEAIDSDDGVDGNGVPTNPVSIALEQVISRELVAIIGDADWFKLVLP